jgi:hypothetical protein
MLVATFYAASAYYKADHLVGTERVSAVRVSLSLPIFLVFFACPQAQDRRRLASCTEAHAAEHVEARRIYYVHFANKVLKLPANPGDPLMDYLEKRHRNGLPR